MLAARRHSWLLFVVFASSWACGGGSTGEPPSSHDAGDPSDGPPSGIPFTADFVFGTAVAGFQVDMGCPSLDRAVCTDPNSDWYAFTTSPRTTLDPSAHLSGQDPSVVGPGFW